MIYTAIDNFYLEDAELENSPSRAHGIDKETETTLRIYGCELIQEGGVLLKFPQAVMATGQVLFHRFYCKHSMRNYNVKKLAATALWLGGKLEEVDEVSSHPEKLLRKVLVVVDRITLRREGQKLSLLEPGTKDYNTFKEACIRYERDMLKSLGFITHVEHPHKLLLNYCQVIKVDKAAPELVQEAWSVANDSLRTTLCVRFKSETVAGGVIFYAARRLKVPLPEDVPWWEVFGVKREQVYEVARVMHELYSRPKAMYIPVYRHIAPSKPSTPATPIVVHTTKADAAAPAGGADSHRPPAGPEAAVAAEAEAGGSASRDGAASGGMAGARGEESSGRADGGAPVPSTSSQQQADTTPAARPSGLPGPPPSSADSALRRGSPMSPPAKRQRTRSRSPSRSRPPRAPADPSSGQKPERERHGSRDGRDGRDGRAEGHDRERSGSRGAEHQRERSRGGRDDRGGREGSRDGRDGRERDRERERPRERDADYDRQRPAGYEYDRGGSRDRGERGGRQPLPYNGADAGGPRGSGPGRPDAGRGRYGSANDLQQLPRDGYGGRGDRRDERRR